MENSLKGLILAAGTIITCVVISLGFFISREAKNTASGGAKQINKINTEFAESDKAIYDGANVSGSEVISVIRKMEDEKIGVYVETTLGASFYGYDFDLASGLLVNVNNNTYTYQDEPTYDDYINPYASFRGETVRNSNDVITGIIFRQQS